MDMQIAMVIALVALVRKYAPSVDGWRVLATAAAAAALVMTASSLPLPWGAPILKGLMVLLGACGGTAFVQGLTDRHAVAVGKSLASNGELK